MANRDYSIGAPDGSTLTINGPEDATPAQLRAAAESAYKIVKQGGGQPAADKPGIVDQFTDGVKNFYGKNAVLGLVNGSASIGATLQHALNPMEWGDSKASTQRRADIGGALDSLGADKNSAAFKTATTLAEIAGTAGVGGAMGKAAGTAAGYLGATQTAAPVVNALASSGFNTGLNGAPAFGNAIADLALRSAAGGAVAGASTALTGSEHIGIGAAIGAGLPGVLKSLGAASNWVMSKVADMTAKGDSAGASALLKALGAATPQQQQQIVSSLRAAPELVPGSRPTVAQALRTPEASTLEQIVSDSPGGSGLKSVYLNQNAARLNAIEGVAPTVATGAKEASGDLGNAITRYAQAEEGMASKANKAQYAAVDPTQVSRTALPANAMEGAADRFIGAGSVGKNQTPFAFAREAQDLSGPVVTPASRILGADGAPMVAASSTPRGAQWDEVMRMRASLNEQIGNAVEKGDNQAAAAMMQQKTALDSAIEKNLPPDMLGRWQEANASFANNAQRFKTGPQSGIFATRNGEPTLQSGEVTRKFWSASPGAAEDVQAFRRLVDENPALLGQFRSMVTTEGAGTATAGGNLGAKFPKWLDQNLPGLRKAFDPVDVQSLQNIAEDIRRAAQADAAGSSKGSSTYRNVAGALSNGLLDSKMLEAAANKVPVVKYAAGPALAGARAWATKGKAESLAGLMGDSGQAANAIEALIQAGASPKEANRLAELLGRAATRTAPVAYSSAGR